MASRADKHYLAIVTTALLALVGGASAMMVVAAVLPLLPGPAIPITDGAAGLLPILGALALVAVVPPLAFVAAICWALDRSQPVRVRGSWAVICVAWAAVSFMVGMSGQTNARELRIKAYADLARRSQPLVTAIRAYEHDHGQAPPTLAALVPRYLPTAPRLWLLGGYQWDYKATIPWHLGIDCTWGFDLVYFAYDGGRAAIDAEMQRRRFGQWTLWWVDP